MAPLDTRTASPLRTLGRHQVGSAIATVVDFGSMIFLVERMHAAPVIATSIGALLGAFANFALGRAWVFRRQTGRPSGQAVRYVLVSAASASLNTLGEHLLHDIAHVQYVVARALVAVAVSLVWNFPLQRTFVFHEGGTR